MVLSVVAETLGVGVVELVVVEVNAVFEGVMNREDELFDTGVSAACFLNANEELDSRLNATDPSTG